MKEKGGVAKSIETNFEYVESVKRAGTAWEFVVVVVVVVVVEVYRVFFLVFQNSVKGVGAVVRSRGHGLMDGRPRLVR